jgi:hypothetical protein
VPAGTVPAVVVGFVIEYLTTLLAIGWNPIIRPVDPPTVPSELSDPITISPSSLPVKANVPFVVPAPLNAETVAAVNAAVP